MNKRKGKKGNNKLNKGVRFSNYGKEGGGSTNNKEGKKRKLETRGDHRVDNPIQTCNLTKDAIVRLIKSNDPIL